jgi:hypothetical protein
MEPEPSPKTGPFAGRTAVAQSHLFLRTETARGEELAFDGL